MTSRLQREEAELNRDGFKGNRSGYGSTLPVTEVFLSFLFFPTGRKLFCDHASSSYPAQKNSSQKKVKTDFHGRHKGGKQGSEGQRGAGYSGSPLFAPTSLLENNATVFRWCHINQQRSFTSFSSTAIGLHSTVLKWPHQQRDNQRDKEAWRTGRVPGLDSTEGGVYIRRGPAGARNPTLFPCKPPRAACKPPPACSHGVQRNLEGRPQRELR